jgi:hypothetical protein
MAGSDRKSSMLVLALKRVRVRECLAKVNMQWSSADCQRDGEQNDGQGPSAQ